MPRTNLPVSAKWLWATGSAHAALATGNLAVIVRAYRTATGTSQRELAQALGYDPTYVSMIETGRREITDVVSRLRIARYLGVPARVVGVTDPDDADFAAMLQFGESTIRLATVARHAGHGTEAVNELWPVVARLEARVADGHVEREILLLLARARAELGVSLGYVLPDERLTSAARWTGRALRLAERLDDHDLLVFALRVHGNELRKAGRPAPAMSRLCRALEVAADNHRGPVLMQLARAVGDTGDAAAFEAVMDAAARVVDRRPSGLLVHPLALHEVRLRGLLTTGQTFLAIKALDTQPLAGAVVPPQWQAIVNVTIGEVLTAQGEIPAAQAAFTTAISIAESYRLPHQIQRILRGTDPRTEESRNAARTALMHIHTWSRT